MHMLACIIHHRILIDIEILMYLLKVQLIDISMRY